MCPYYNDGHKSCNISGCYQDDSQRQSYCISSSWKYCANYTNSSLQTKVDKAVRFNSEL
jgi:hypothetical protein